MVWFFLLLNTCRIRQGISFWLRVKIFVLGCVLVYPLLSGCSWKMRSSPCRLGILWPVEPHRMRLPFRRLYTKKPSEHWVCPVCLLHGRSQEFPLPTFWSQPLLAMLREENQLSWVYALLWTDEQITILMLMISRIGESIMNETDLPPVKEESPN